MGALAAFAAPAYAQTLRGVLRTSFEIVSGKIFAPIEVNGTQVEAIIDSGSEVSAIDAEFAGAQQVRTQGRFSGVGLQGRVTGAWAQGVSMSIARQPLTVSRVAVLDYKGLARQLSRPVEAVIGRDLFDQYAVGIDFDDKIISLGASGTLAGEGPHVSLTPRRGRMSVPISVEGGQPLEALLDLGNDLPLILSPSPGTRRLLLARPTSTTLLGGYGGASVAQVATARQIAIGSAALSGVPVHVPRRSIGFDANLGLPILQQFSPIIDFAAARLVLGVRRVQPGFRKNLTGLDGYLDGPVLRITHVAPGSPAARAGFRAGDGVTEINGEAAPIGNGHVAEALAGQTVEFTMAGGAKRRLTLAEYY